MNLREKASKIDFASTSPNLNPNPNKDIAGSNESNAAKVKTAPGAMLSYANTQRSEMLKENEELKKKAGDVDILNSRLNAVMKDLKQWDGAKATKLIDSTHIVASEWANRDEASFLTVAFRDLVDEIASAGGNIQPIKVRPLSNSDPQQYEVIFGHRRHRACLELGYPVLALVDPIDNKELFIEMDRENRQRADLRPFEQGLMYRKALDKGLFPSFRALCEATGANLGNGSLALRLAKMPEKILNIFPSKLDIQYRWIQPLLLVIEKDIESVLHVAQEIEDEKKAGAVFSSSDVYNKLINSQSSLTSIGRIMVGKNIPIYVNGKTVATIKYVKNRYRIDFEKEALPDGKVQDLKVMLTSLIA